MKQHEDALSTATNTLQAIIIEFKGDLARIRVSECRSAALTSATSTLHTSLTCLAIASLDKILSGKSVQKFFDTKKPISDAVRVAWMHFGSLR
jgi:hypothetical protein